MLRNVTLLAALGTLTALWSAASAAPPFPSEVTAFRAYSGNPVFTAAGPGHWDENIRERGWILRDNARHSDGTEAEEPRWRLWYTGYANAPDATRKLGLATSTDGLHWNRHPGNPIYDADWVEDMMIVPHGGRLYMFAEGRGDQAQLLTSDDGVAWSHVATLDVRLADGEPIPAGPFGTPTAFVEDGLWHLFYERRDAGVWHATSRDLKVWTNVSDTPVLLPGPDGYDARLIAVNQILKHDGRYYALYHGSDGLGSPNLWTSNLAVSDDLRTWTKYPGNPLFPPQANRSSNMLVPLRSGTYRLYTLHPQVEAFLPLKTNKTPHATRPQTTPQTVPPAR